jgi:ABC-type transport system substrate-binding protein
MPMPPRLRRPTRWLVLVALLLAAAAGSAQPPNRKGQPKPPPKAPPVEEEDPAAKPVKPPPSLDDAPKPAAPAAPTEGPGVPPPPGVLVVGVRTLPVRMSPQFARTDSEVFALDLLFEGLLRPGPDAAGGLVYEPALARELPGLVPLGRTFTLTDATWADPARPDAKDRVTAGDIRTTIDKLKARRGQPGAEVADWIDAVTTAADHRGRITLTRGHIDPLSLLTFKVLPAAHKDDLTFATAPVGSGPFMYGGQKEQGGRMYALFPANPDYGKRPGQMGLPKLQAVWLVEARNPAADFKRKLFHFALTTHTSDLKEIEGVKKAAETPGQAGRLEVNIERIGRTDTLTGRRIYFLAVNHQSPLLGEGETGRRMRRFLGYAIRRDAILTDCFRAGFEKHHQPLSGPFPPGTWPCSPVAGSLDYPDVVRGSRPVSGNVDLELKYPDDDPVVAEACKRMADQVAELKAGVTLKLQPVKAENYYKEVFQERSFQLAYWHYDYPNDWFNPAGLFDAAAQEFQGRNFMRYVPPTALSNLLVKCQDRRDFGEVRQAMQQLHATFATEMPFIPLWHLDTHALLAAGLTTVPPANQLDPLAPFTHIEQWSVR